MGVKTLVRPDGSTVRVTDEDASKLSTLGYREQSSDEARAEGAAHAEKQFYSTPLQQVTAGAEGFGQGLFLGLLPEDEDSRLRAEYNPGTRLATELVGGIAPSLIDPAAEFSSLEGVSRLGAATPAGLLTRGAAYAGRELGAGSKFAEGLIRGGIEGAGFGAAGELTQAKLNGDPVTAEAILGGIGWGTLYGGGLGALAGGLEGRLEAKLAAKEAERAEILAPLRTEFKDAAREARSFSAIEDSINERHLGVKNWEEHHFNEFMGTVDDARNVLKGAAKTAEEGVTDSVGALDFGALKKARSSVYSGLANEGVAPSVKANVTGYERAFQEAMRAAEEGDYKRVVKNLDKFQVQMGMIETKLGPKVPGVISGAQDRIAGAVQEAQALQGLAKFKVDNAMKAAEEATSYAAISSTLESIPRSAEALSGMTSAKAEKISAALDHIGKLKSAELEGVKTAVTNAVDKLAQNLGVELEGSTGSKFREIHSLIKGGRSERAAEKAAALAKGELVWGKAKRAAEKLEEAKTAPLKSGKSEQPWYRRYVDRGAGYFGGVKASEAARKAGLGSVGGIAAYEVGKNVTLGLLGLKGAVISTIGEHVDGWTPRIAKSLRSAGPRIEPLVTRLDGTIDQENKTRTELMMARAKEIHDAAPSVRDTLFKSVSPLTMPHPDLAAAMHAVGVKQFQFMLSKVPKDPGLAFKAFQSMWRPDPMQIEKFARYYEVFQNPVKVMVRALQTGKITPEAAEGLAEMNPGVFSEFRARMLLKISDPDIRKSMTYNDLVNIGMMIRTPLHSTMDPRFVASQQQMYTERNQPLSMQPQTGTGSGSAGRPPGPGPSTSPGASSGQKITEH